MTPKEVMEKTYECFASGDMETFQKLHTDDCVFTMNGAHQLSGTYNGFADFILNGGMVSLSVSPMEPLSAETAPQIEALMADPDGLVDYLGLEFVYEAPEEAEAE